MNIELNPKYQIGDKLDWQEKIDDHIIKSIRLEVTGIMAHYDFKTNNLKYNYDLSYAEGQFKGWLYTTTSLYNHHFKQN